MTFPAAVPEVPVTDVDEAVGYYVRHLGFTFDWGDNAAGIGGVSRGDCRLFLTNAVFRSEHSRNDPARFWINLNSRAEVDALCAEWKSAGARLVSEPEDKPWKLREFIAADLDGNLIRVFYDFSRDREVSV